MDPFDDLQLDPDADLPLYLQVAEGVVAAVACGRLRPGDAVPGTRTLAERLGVSRNVAVAAFQELLAQGLLVCEVGAGTRIAADLPTDFAPGRLSAGLTGPSWGFDLPSRLAPAAPEVAGRAVLDLRGDRLDPRLVPSTEVARAYRRALERQRPGDGVDLRGHGDLRAGLAAGLAEHRGLPTDPERLLLTGGVHDALTRLAVAFLKPGDRVGLEHPGHPTLTQVVTLAGGVPVPLAVDAQGLVPEALEEALAQGPLRMLWLSPAAQVPTTVPLAQERRLRILELAVAHRVAVVEDDRAGELYLGERPSRPLAAEDPRGVVIHVGTPIALLGSGLTLGWVRGPRALIDRLASLRDPAEAASAWPLEQAVRDLLLDGLLARQGRKIRAAARERRDALAAAWEARTGLQPPLPEAGLALWAPVPEGTSATNWAHRALQAGLRVEPGAAFHREGVDLPALHLGYGSLQPDELSAAVDTLLGCRP